MTKRIKLFQVIFIAEIFIGMFCELSEKDTCYICDTNATCNLNNLACLIVICSFANAYKILLFILVAYLSYGPYGSFGPTYDSSLANITKEESDLLLDAYGSDVGLHYSKRFVYHLNRTVM